MRSWQMGRRSGEGRPSQRTALENARTTWSYFLVILQKRVAGLSAAALDKFLARARRATGLRGTVNVLVTGSRELRALNKKFRGKDKATDVLSFPAIADIAVKLAGEVAISAEIAATNAQRLGHSAEEEVQILILHGVLHLSGYDHETDAGEMADLERELRQRLKLPIGLIERTEARGLVERARAKPTARGRNSGLGRSR